MRKLLARLFGGRGARSRDSDVDFLPDAEEIERRPVPFAAYAAVYLLAGLAATALVWASVSEVDQIVVTRGRVITLEPSIMVQPLETAVIKSIDVRVGQVVTNGQVLARLDATFASADAAQLRTRLESLQAQISRLESEIKGRPGGLASAGADAKLQASLYEEKQGHYRDRLLRLDEAISRARAGLATNARDQQVLGERVKSLREIESLQEKLLEAKFGARLKLLEARERRLEVERDSEIAVNREKELRHELASAEAERGAFVREWRQKAMEELVAARRDHSAAAEQLQKADRRNTLVELVAPTAGVVLEVAKRSVGSVIREAEPFITLVPMTSVLEAEVQIESGDIGYVKPGDPVRIKLDAYPFQRHGTVDGRLRTVSEDSFQRDRSATGLSGLYYLGRVAVSDMKLRRVPAEARLIPGMTLTGEIVVGKQTVISYFIYPLMRGLDEAIREPGG